jgi:hypothetical protein
MNAYFNKLIVIVWEEFGEFLKRTFGYFNTLQRFTHFECTFTDDSDTIGYIYGFQCFAAIESKPFNLPNSFSDRNISQGHTPKESKFPDDSYTFRNIYAGEACTE